MHLYKNHYTECVLLLFINYTLILLLVIIRLLNLEISYNFLEFENVETACKGDIRSEVMPEDDN